jgi:anti-sigma regulatory factor (Ser/Thr protein kinase)
MTSPNSNPCDLCLELVSNPLYLCGVREMVAQISRRLGFTDSQCSQIALAIDEALTNIMKHGYERRIDGRIWLRLKPTTDARGSALEVIIEDEAKQVDPCQIKGRDLEDIRPGGLGVHIIKEVMDEVRYEKRNGAGMRLTMIKRQSPTPATASPTTPKK